MAGDLVFRGVVEAIESSPLGVRGVALDWVVHTRVEKIISGTFDFQHFAFRVHSPSRAGLAVGKHYTITATWTGAGYRVDENQWR